VVGGAIAEIISRRRLGRPREIVKAGGFSSSNFRSREDPPSSHARTAAKRLNVKPAVSVEIPDQGERTAWHSFILFVSLRGISAMKKREEKQRIRWAGYCGPVVGCAAGFSVNPRDGPVGTCAILPRPFSNVHSSARPAIVEPLQS
jgi:hypothetical protein